MGQRLYGTGRILATKRRDRWRIKYRVGRHEKTETITGSKRDAQALLNERLVALQRGEYVLPTREALGALIDRWLDHKVRSDEMRAITARSYRQILRPLERSPLAARPVAKIQAREIDEFPSAHFRRRRPGVQPVKPLLRRRYPIRSSGEIEGSDTIRQAWAIVSDEMRAYGAERLANEVTRRLDAANHPS